MNDKPRGLPSALKAMACAAFMACAAIHAQDAAGVWTWTTPGRNGGPDRTNSLTLKIEDSKLTGKLASPSRGGRVSETAISDAKSDGDGISFVVIREFNGNSITNRYSGKVAADKINGKIEVTRDGEVQSRNWEATRSDSK
jgi:hypothetical protein